MCVSLTLEISTVIVVALGEVGREGGSRLQVCSQSVSSVCNFITDFSFVLISNFVLLSDSKFKDTGN